MSNTSGVVALREIFDESDIEWITEACQDPEIQRWTLVPRPYTRDHARHFVEHPELERQRWVIENDGDPIGVIGVHGVNEIGDAEIGYWLAPRGR
ncbi:MAG: GNAT family N-acetyltransferase, partial [Ilumatobacteraceae bacterium]